MRKPYPITPHRHPSRAMPSMPVPERRVSMLALQEEIQLPAHHGPAGTRRLKILRIEQASVLPDSRMIPNSTPREPAPAYPHVEAPPRRTLPPPQGEPLEFEGWLEGRAVRLRGVGEVMADEAGNYYEVKGQQLRPLGELVNDERGRIFEVQPMDETTPAAEERSNGSPDEQATPAPTNKSSHRVETPPQPARAQVTRSPDSPAYCKIVADPGLYLKLPWARVKSELAPQLEHPEKLRDHDLIECYAQIYEAQRTLLASELATLELGNGLLTSQLHPLTQAKAQMLGAPQLFKLASEPFERQAANRQIYAGQRVYRLWPLFDPTASVGQTVSLPLSSQSAFCESQGRPSVCLTSSEEKDSTLRRQIPQQYLNPLQFKHSREEVLYDMDGLLGTLPVESGAFARWLFVYPLRLLKSLATLLRSRRGLKKWRAMLVGKGLDEQLWAVTPPHGFTYHPTVRRWAEKTLVREGYDLACMFLEWEIYWRRRKWD